MPVHLCEPQEGRTIMVDTLGRNAIYLVDEARCLECLFFFFLNGGLGTLVHQKGYLWLSKNSISSTVCWERGQDEMERGSYFLRASLFSRPEGLYPGQVLCSRASVVHPSDNRCWTSCEVYRKPGKALSLLPRDSEKDWPPSKSQRWLSRTTLMLLGSWGMGRAA